MSCEHGLKTKECYVCMSPKYGKHDTKQERVAKPQEKRHEWVGLTKDELFEIAGDGPDYFDWKVFGRAIEAKLKDKNNDRR